MNPYNPEEGDKKMINPHLAHLAPRNTQSVFYDANYDQELEQLANKYMVSSLAAVETGFLVGFVNAPIALNY